MRHVLARPLATAIILDRVLPPAMLVELRLETLALSSASYPRPSRTPLDSDLVFTAHLRRSTDAEPCTIDIMLDHQSTPDDLLPWRSHVYAGALWARWVDAQPRRPRRLPFILPVLLTQYPARNTPTRLSEILSLPNDLREAFGAPFEATVYIDDLSGSVLDSPVADPGHRALVEITRILLFAYKNSRALADPRLATLGPLFDTVLDHFGPSEIEELLSYVVHVFGEGSPFFAMIMSTLTKAVEEVYVTIADKLRTEGRTEGRAMAKAEAVLGVLEHRAWPIPAPLRDRVLATADEQLLERWFHRALAARSLEEVFEHLDA